MRPVLRLRKYLQHPEPAPVWPEGISLVPVSSVDLAALHHILANAYDDDSVPAFAPWWAAVSTDSEYEAELFLVAVDRAKTPVGVALCWNTGFIKDVAVIPTGRGKGIGEALMRAAFATFAQRGVDYVDLKAYADNAPAVRLYRRLGMTEAPV